MQIKQGAEWAERCWRPPGPTAARHAAHARPAHPAPGPQTPQCVPAPRHGPPRGAPSTVPAECVQRLVGWCLALSCGLGEGILTHGEVPVRGHSVGNAQSIYSLTTVPIRLQPEPSREGGCSLLPTGNHFLFFF